MCKSKSIISKGSPARRPFGTPAPICPNGSVKNPEFHPDSVNPWPIGAIIEKPQRTPKTRPSGAKNPLGSCATGSLRQGFRGATPTPPIRCAVVLRCRDAGGFRILGLRGWGRAGDRATLETRHHEKIFSFFPRTREPTGSVILFIPPRARLTATMDTSIEQSVGTAIASDQPIELPNWLTVPDPPEPKRSKEAKALALVQFESAFPRILEKMYSGSTLQAAIDDDFRELDSGAFLRWIKKDPLRLGLYKEAKEIRTEAWAGKIIEHAVASDSAEDVQRSKLIVDTYKWLMAADNRKQYGDTKQIDFGGTISITGALAAAQARVIEAEVEDVTPRLESE